MCHVTIYSKVIGPHCTVQRDKAHILDSPDPYCTLQSQVVTYYEVFEQLKVQVTACDRLSCFYEEQLKSVWSLFSFLLFMVT